jgi:hypothetical protein
MSVPSHFLPGTTATETSYRGNNFPIPCCRYQSVPFLILTHLVTPVYTSKSSLLLRPLRFYLSAVSRWHSAKVLWLPNCRPCKLIFYPVFVNGSSVCVCVCVCVCVLHVLTSREWRVTILQGLQGKCIYRTLGIYVWSVCMYRERIFCLASTLCAVFSLHFVD